MARAGAVAIVAVVGLAACGSSGSRAAEPSAATPHAAAVVDTRLVSGLGPVLTTSSGMTLYMFPRDAERHVTCTGACAGSWPPLTTPTGTTPHAGSGVQQSLLGVDSDPGGGGPVVTYNGWPLYTYEDDLAPGETSGQGLDLDGGYWYVIAPSGQPITVGGASGSG